MTVSANALNIKSAGIPVFDGSATWTESTTTQFNVLVGSTSNAIVNVAPSSTAGVPLISGGSAANPSFGTAVVAGGGTGLASLTAHSLQVGAGTSNVTQIAVGATGNTLMGSTGADPSWTGSPSFSGSATAASGLTATSGAITATSGDVVITSGNLDITAATTSNVGQITQAGARLLHTYGTDNTFLGSGSGNFTLTATGCTAIGTNAGAALTASTNSTFLGYNAGTLCTSNAHVGVGAGALASITNMNGSTAVGRNALTLCTGGQNVAVGNTAGNSLVAGISNTFLGSSAGISYTSSESSNILLGYNTTGTIGESNVCRIGNATGTGTGQIAEIFIAGINGVTVTGSAVLCSTSGQLGTIASSERFKNNIVDMENDSSDIYKLRPVSFFFNEEAPFKQTPGKQYGLIAEEVEKIMPDMVVHQDDGSPYSVKYHDLPALLLNELQKLNKRVEELELKLAQKRVY